MWVDIRLTLEKTLRPYVVAEFHQLEHFELRGGGLLWPRQKWYLPYVIGMYLLCTGAVLATIFVKSADSVISEQLANASQLSPAQYQQVLRTLGGQLWERVETPLALLGLFLLVTAGLSAWRLARYQSEGALSVQRAVAALASGTPRLPDWVGTDEVGDLAMATARVFVHLKSFSTSLGESARSLAGSALSLSTSTAQQNEVLVRQAAAIQQTQVTAQEIKETSLLAAQKAENVVRQTQQADAISRMAEEAIERSVKSLQDIREHGQQMARHVQQLGEKARQIASITVTVKDLADQSNMLALNAAIEAVRSGEQGKGFGVVAREIRTLANQSIRATTGVRTILEDIGTAIKQTVSISERGAVRVKEGMEQVREFGESVRQLSNMVRESGASVRQISASVAQQNTGIEEIFKSVSEVSQAMDQTMDRLRASEEALVMMSSVSDKVSDFVRGYDWQDVRGSGQPKPPHG
jgi:methyl-accepting chemotaxis protein